MFSIGKILTLGLLAGTKFLLAPFAAALPPYSLDFWQAMIITTTGGIAGIITFVFFGDFVISRWSILVYYFKRMYTSKEKLDE